LIRDARPRCTAGILEDRDEKNKGGALFYREYGRTASYYANRTFEPVFEPTPELIIPANRSADIQKANELCGDSYQCKYDYAVSLNRDLAFYTLQYQDGFVNTKKMSKQRGKCGAGDGGHGANAVGRPSLMSLCVVTVYSLCWPPSDFVRSVGNAAFRSEEQFPVRAQH